MSKGKVTLTAGAGKTVSSSMQMKMIAGRSISISVRPLLGIEMARLYIANDEIIILDRYHKIYVREKASVLTSGVPVDINTLQDILLGRPHILGKGTFTAALAGDVMLTADNGTVKLTPVEQYDGFNYAYVFSALMCRQPEANRFTALIIATWKPRLPGKLPPKLMWQPSSTAPTLRWACR